MWLNGEQVIDSMVDQYRESLLCSCPNHVVIDGLFDESTLDEVMSVLQQSRHWKTQQHTYAALYVDSSEWNNASKAERFVQRDVWQRGVVSANQTHNIAHEFLSYLRSDEFMSVLSRIFNVQLTDINVAAPEINTNYFRLAPTDFVEQHADDSPGRKVCMLLYLNKGWSHKAGGKLGFAGETVGKGVDKVTGKRTSKKNSQAITIAPLYNRCVLFDPSSEGSEHWVEKLQTEYADQYRYNVTSWYWGE